MADAMGYRLSPLRGSADIGLPWPFMGWLTVMAGPPEGVMQSGLPKQMASAAGIWAKVEGGKKPYQVPENEGAGMWFALFIIGIGLFLWI